MNYLKVSSGNQVLAKVHQLLKEPIIIGIMLICAVASQKLYLPIMELVNKISEISLYQTILHGIKFSMEQLQNNLEYQKIFFKFTIKINKLVFEKLDLSIIENFPEEFNTQIIFYEGGRLGKPLLHFLKCMPLKDFQTLLKQKKSIDWKAISTNAKIANYSAKVSSIFFLPTLLV